MSPACENKILNSVATEANDSQEQTVALVASKTSTQKLPAERRAVLLGHTDINEALAVLSTGHRFVVATKCFPLA